MQVRKESAFQHPPTQVKIDKLLGKTNLKIKKNGEEYNLYTNSQGSERSILHKSGLKSEITLYAKDISLSSH